MIICCYILYMYTVCRQYFWLLATLQTCFTPAYDSLFRSFFRSFSNYHLVALMESLRTRPWPWGSSRTLVCSPWPWHCMLCAHEQRKSLWILKRQKSSIFSSYHKRQRLTTGRHAVNCEPRINRAAVNHCLDSIKMKAEIYAEDPWEVIRRDNKFS